MECGEKYSSSLYSKYVFYIVLKLICYEDHKVENGLRDSPETKALLREGLHEESCIGCETDLPMSNG